MLGYLSKFVLQMLPTITATVIGAYIVSTWINPKAPAAGATRTATWPSNKLAEGSAKPTEPAAPAVATEITDDARAESAEKVRVIPIVKPSESAAERPVSAAAVMPPASPAQIQEHKNAAELARIAIERLRGDADAQPVSHEPAARPAATILRSPPRPALASLPPAPAGQLSVPPATSATLATAAPPLPPAITITTPNPPPALHTVADKAAVGADRLVPPQEVPTVHNPLSLQASHRATESPSIADDVLSATKSFFRAISPQQLQR